MITRRRHGPRIDYNILNNSGAIVVKGSRQRTMSSGEDESKSNVSKNTAMIMTGVLGGMEEMNNMMDEHQVNASNEETKKQAMKWSTR